ncbi:MAG: FlgD immunoglobulin-like domain containing protein [Candidatus Krumholzibacteria bacterium]|nr:FlgD immunoglobulin-like domain containing protein [Candidatus Krumholzibacteria bacterium]
MRRAIGTLLSVLLCTVIFTATPARAYWVKNGVGLCTAMGTQTEPSVVSDGAGGAIVAWEDYRNGNSDIYAQRVDALGNVLWTSGGVALCTAGGIQQHPMTISDGAGGAIVTWHDSRNSSYDIYAQKVDATGTVQWTTNGIVLCSAAGHQLYPTIASDGADGAIVTWYDFRDENWDIYAQKVNASGIIQWTSDGVPLCTAVSDQTNPVIVSDDAGGAVVAWYDYRDGNWDIYAQRVDATGTVQWIVDGIPLCMVERDQQYPAIASDGVGGAIVTWLDYRESNYDIYAQRVNATGTVQWTTDGVAICTATGLQWYPAITSDGVGGAIITWHDDSYSIYAQRVDAIGTVQWTTDGIAICTATGLQWYPVITSDGVGGAIVTWLDDRDGNYDIYAQRVDASGTTQWTTDGIALCSATTNQYYPAIASDGAGGAIVTWYDSRSGNYDIYVQSVDARGAAGLLAPAIRSVRDVPGDEGGRIYLSWYAARADLFMDSRMSYYSLWRAIDASGVAQALDAGATTIDDLSELNAASSDPVLFVESTSSRTFFWELVETVDAYYMEAYGKPIATLFDSTAECTEYHYFQVVAHSTTPTLFWKSDPDSGYSVDNLPPGTPIDLAGEQSFVPVGLRITWTENEESDLSRYNVYRGTSEDFVPGSGNLAATLDDNEWFDSSWSWDAGYCYKISATDLHGNESGYALLDPDNITDTETPGAPRSSYLSQNYPNPFNPTTSISFGLSAPGHVSLRIYDVAGRLMREIVNGDRQAGKYRETWDGRDSNGRTVASGIYFCKLSAGSFVETRKMALMR